VIDGPQDHVIIVPYETVRDLGRAETERLVGEALTKIRAGPVGWFSLRTASRTSRSRTTNDPRSAACRRSSLSVAGRDRRTELDGGASSTVRVAPLGSGLPWPRARRLREIPPRGEETDQGRVATGRFSGQSTRVFVAQLTHYSDAVVVLRGSVSAVASATPIAQKSNPFATFKPCRVDLTKPSINSELGPTLQHDRRHVGLCYATGAPYSLPVDCHGGPPEARSGAVVEPQVGDLCTRQCRRTAADDFGDQADQPFVAKEPEAVCLAGCAPVARRTDEPKVRNTTEREVIGRVERRDAFLDERVANRAAHCHAGTRWPAGCTVRVPT